MWENEYFKKLENVDNYKFGDNKIFEIKSKRILLSIK